MALGTGPLVTVGIPSYNHADLLPEAVDSVLGQSYANIELLLLDDGSTDRSYELAKRYALRDERVRLLTHEGHANRGILATVNALCAEARGEYVALLAADDVLTSDSLERRVATAVRNPDALLVYGRIDVLGPDGRATGRQGGQPLAAMSAYDGTADPLQSLLLHNFIPSPSVLVRRDVFELVGGYDERFYYSDWELWMRVLAHGRAVFVDGGPLAGYRIHGRALTQADADADRPRKLELFRVLDEKASSIGGRFREPRLRALVRLQRAFHAAELGEAKEARESIVSAFALDPTLRTDADYLFWWVGARQHASLAGAGARADRWLRALAPASRGLDAAVEAGARAGHFGCWALQAAKPELSPEVFRSLAWAVIANEVEASGSPRLRLRVLRSCLAHGTRQPRLLSERWFVKTVLAAGGVWPLVTRVRRWTAARR